MISVAIANLVKRTSAIHNRICRNDNCKLQSSGFTGILQYAISLLLNPESPAMPDVDVRGESLRSFDRFAAEFKTECLTRFEAGGAVAEADIERLTGLADSVAGHVAAWVRALDGLETAACQPIQPAQAGRLVIESVLDMALTGPALGLLGAALDLALARP
jgi:hypothetical protein